MATIIKNLSLEPLALPLPFRGILSGLRSVTVDCTVAEATAALGGTAWDGKGLSLTEVADPVSFPDDWYRGSVGDSGTSVAVAMPNKRVPYGNSDGTGLASAADLTFDSTTKALSVTNGLNVDATDATGTPGNATISKRAGKFAVALGASAVTITNTLVTANSIILVTKIDNDATLTDYKVVAGSGSFVLTGNATATAACKFAFLVINPTS